MLSYGDPTHSQGSQELGHQLAVAVRGVVVHQVTGAGDPDMPGTGDDRRHLRHRVGADAARSTRSAPAERDRVDGVPRTS